MKRVLLLFMLFCLLARQIKAQTGLKGEYYNGINFEHKVLTRIDPDINLHWDGHGPAPGVDPFYNSIRWTGKLLAPVSGKYIFSAKVDDGIRVWVGNRKIIDMWQLNDSKKFTADVVLQAGHYYDLRVEYFNAMLEGEISLFWKRPDQEKPLISFSRAQGEPITSAYFRLAAPPVSVPPKVVSVPPKITLEKPKSTITKAVVPVAKPPLKPVALATRKPTVVAKPPSATIETPGPPTVIAEPTLKLAVGETVVLRNVQFEQSSYVLLPESSVELDRLVQVLKSNPQWHLDVAGHTDNVGDPRLNRALSENRAKVVAHYLSSHGIAEERIDTKGYGGSQPIADNAIETERLKNRRVTITVR